MVIIAQRIKRILLSNKFISLFFWFFTFFKKLYMMQRKSNKLIAKKMLISKRPLNIMNKMIKTHAYISLITFPIVYKVPCNFGYL